MNLQNITNKKKIFIIISLFIILLLAILLIPKKKKTQPEILAQVENKIITKRDFILNYEFGLPHLKFGQTSLERKKNYLQFMINEYLLALDAEAKGMHEIPRVKYQAEKIKRELLLENIIENDVKPKVFVNMKEIKEAINKSKVSFKFFYWSENDIENALIIKEMFEKDGIEETFKKLGSRKSDFHFDTSKYITDYLTWLDMPEETFNAIKDLPANKFSDPIKIDNHYFIFQIQDIRRESVTKSEYLDKASTFRKILYNGKLQDEVINYVDSIVTPNNIRTKTKVFNIFADAIIDWYRAEDKESLVFSDWAKNHKESATIKKFYNYQDSVLLTYHDGEFTLGEFQKYYYFDRISEEYQTKHQFKNHLVTLIALSIRDYFLVLEAEKKDYDKSPWFEHEFTKWTSKFVFEEQLNKYMSEKSNGNSTLKSKINNDLELLKLKYQITIDYRMLDTLSVNETDKSKQSAVQLIKGGINRLAEPIVDGHWKSIGN